MENILMTIGIFAGLQTANVILQSLRTLLMAKVDCPHKNAAMNAVAFGFYVVIVQQVANVPLTITIPLTVVTNVIGIYATFAIFRKMRRDELWKVEIFAKTPEITAQILETLRSQEIPVTEHAPQFVTAYCYNQAQSTITRNVIKQWGVLHNVTKVAQL